MRSAARNNFKVGRGVETFVPRGWCWHHIYILYSLLAIVGSMHLQNVFPLLQHFAANAFLLFDGYAMVQVWFNTLTTIDGKQKEVHCGMHFGKTPV